MTTKKNTARKTFANHVAPTLTAPTAEPKFTVMAGGKPVEMTRAALLALLTSSEVPATTTAPASKPAVIKAPTAKPATVDGQSRSGAYIAASGKDPKVVREALSVAYRAGQAAQAGRKNKAGSTAYKAAYNASLVAAGFAPFYS